MNIFDVGSGAYCLRMNVRMEKKSDNIKIFRRNDTKNMTATSDIHVLYCHLWGEHIFVYPEDVFKLVWSCKHAQSRAVQEFRKTFVIPPTGLTDRQWGMLKQCIPLKYLHALMTNVCPKDPRSYNEVVEADLLRLVQHVRKMFPLTLAKKLEQSDNEHVRSCFRSCLQKFERGIIS